MWLFYLFQAIKNGWFLILLLLRHRRSGTVFLIRARRIFLFLDHRRLFMNNSLQLHLDRLKIRLLVSLLLVGLLAAKPTENRLDPAGLWASRWLAAHQLAAACQLGYSFRASSSRCGTAAAHFAGVLAAAAVTATSAAAAGSRSRAFRCLWTGLGWLQLHWSEALGNILQSPNLKIKDKYRYR